MSGVEQSPEITPCPTCGPTTLEQHPRRTGATRCANWKEWLRTTTPEICQVRLTLAPIELKTANAYVTQYHRHHKASHGHKFSVAVRDQAGELRGVAIASRPRAGALDDGESLEVVRVCTDGTPNACSMLYGAVRRAALAMGYEPHRIFTYTLRTEPGTSLHAAGWHRDRETRGGEWTRKDRPRDAALIPDPKVRWRAAPEPSYPPGGEA